VSEEAPRTQVRRIVTANDPDGRSRIVSDGPSPFVRVNGMPNFRTIDLWRTHSMPATFAGVEEPCSLPVKTPPPVDGTLLRVVEFPPDRELMPIVQSGEWLARMKAQGFNVHLADTGKHPLMHRTDTVDYAIVLSGEIWAVLDHDETLMRAGDVLVQRGTNHAWSNRSDQSCLVAFVLVDARPG